jgi:hypothetical protein
VTIRFSCPSCQTAYTVNDQFAGKRSHCKVCGQEVRVPHRHRSKTVLGEPIPPASPPNQSRSRPKPEDRTEDIPASGTALADEPPLEDLMRGYGYVPPVPSRRRWVIPMVGCVVVASGLLVMGLIILLVSKFSDSKTPFSSVVGGDESELLGWAPPESEILLEVDFDALMAVREFRELVDDAKPKNQKVELGLGTKTKVLGAGRGKMGNSESVTIYRLSNNYDPNALIRTRKGTAKQKDGKSYLEVQGAGLWLYNPTTNVVITSGNEKLLQEAMSGKSNEVRVNRDLVRAFHDADGPFRYAAVGPSAQTGPAMSPLLLLAEKDPEPPPLCLSQYLSTTIRSDRTDVKIVSAYSGRDKARAAAEQLNKAMKRAMAMAVARGREHDDAVYFLRVVFDTLKVEASGSTVVMTCEIPHRELKRLKFLAD